MIFAPATIDRDLVQKSVLTSCDPGRPEKSLFYPGIGVGGWTLLGALVVFCFGVLLANSKRALGKSAEL